MNKEIMKELGFEEAVKDVENGVCPFCKKVIEPSKEFRDKQSVKSMKFLVFTRAVRMNSLECEYVRGM